ncbi:hypothetical protein B0H11DRAFT_1290685 [Mycena galericulata]|nr:hypothetical protein B0H11DRAFT_1290685 [Mycena galericulata]
MAGFPLNLTLGPIINGAFFTIFFFGLICMQSINYFKQFPNDIYLIKCVVVFLWVLQMVYTACICQGAYTMAVTDFGEIFSLLYTPWGLNLGVVIGSIIEHSVQAFFVARIYKTTGFLYISILLWIAVAFLQGVSFKLAAEAIKSDSIPITEARFRWLLMLLFFGDATLDVVNACVLCFYLKLQSRATFSQSTLALLDRLVVYTLQTGLTTSFVAIGAAISFTVAPHDYIWVAFYMAMPGSFMSALLANINNRKNLTRPRTVVTSSNLGSGSGTAGIEISRSVVLTRDDIDLASTPKSDASVLNSSIDKVSRPGIYDAHAV